MFAYGISTVENQIEKDMENPTVKLGSSSWKLPSISPLMVVVVVRRRSSVLCLPSSVVRRCPCNRCCFMLLNSVRELSVVQQQPDNVLEICAGSVSEQGLSAWIAGQPQENLQ